MILNEQTLEKIERVTNNAINAPLSPINQKLDDIENRLKKTKLGSKIVRGINADPTKLSAKRNVKEWTTLMGAGSLLTHTPQMLVGDFISPLAISAGNAAKGVVIGALQPGGKDTLLKATVIPAGVMAITTPMINDIGNAMGLGDNVDFAPEARVGLTAGIGGGMWALRNRKNKNRNYI